ncbi:uncharacterized protein [Tiliqua scincoides]|uniref:uncharacterized protein n=1 Tax=Tiliqua scincoides TaxID=71010 RepID=UPI0034621F0C
MASIREVSGIAEDLLCPVCFSIFQDPRMLSCGHNYCLSCLESCVPKGKQQGTCPECRNPFHLHNAARNRVLANLAEKARLLKLEEGSQPGGGGSWYFCEEHEEPLKLFCSQDVALVCVICRDLPQHQGHNFLPIKNAVKCYQDKLKASLGSLEDGVKWATNNQSCQQEAIEELESLSEHLCGCIFIEFEELREILNEREQSMLGTVKQMKGLNQADMEEKLEYLKAFESSHSKTISSIRAALEETSEFAFLKEVKELMGRIQDRLSERKEETGSEVDEDVRGGKESEEKDHGSDEINENQEDGKGNEATSEEEEAYREPQNTEEDAYEDIVPVDPSLGHLEELLCFETWKEMLKSISIEEAYASESYYSSSPPPEEEDILQPGGNNVSVEVEEEARAKLISATETGTLIPEESSFDKQTSLPNNRSNLGAPMGGAPYIPPPIPCISNFQVPVFQQFPHYNSVHGWGPPRRWTPHPKQGPGMLRGRGMTHRQPHHFNWGQGRGYSTLQMSQPCGGNFVSHKIWSPPRNESPKAKEAHAVGQRGGWSNKPKTQSNGGSNSSQNGGGSAKKEPPKPWETHASRQGGSGQGSTKKPPAPHNGAKVPSVSRGSQSRPHHGGGRGRGHGSSSAKGPRNK